MKKEKNLKSGQEKKNMPQSEDNTLAIKSVCFMEIYGVHQVKSGVDSFLCSIEENDSNQIYFDLQHIYQQISTT